MMNKCTPKCMLRLQSPGTCVSCGCESDDHSVNHPHHCLGKRVSIHDKSACPSKSCVGFKPEGKAQHTNPAQCPRGCNGARSESCHACAPEGKAKP